MHATQMAKLSKTDPLGTKTRLRCSRMQSDLSYHNHMVIHFAGEPYMRLIELGIVHRAMNTTNNGDEKIWQ